MFVIMSLSNPGAARLVTADSVSFQNVSFTEEELKIRTSEMHTDHLQQ